MDRGGEINSGVYCARLISEENEWCQGEKEKCDPESLESQESLFRIWIAQYFGGKKALPDKWRVLTLMFTQYAYTDILSTMLYTGMLLTEGCDFHPFNVKMWFVWSLALLPWSLVTQYIGDKTRKHTLQCIFVVACIQLVSHWLCFFFPKRFVSVTTYMITSAGLQLQNLLTARFTKQRCAKVYGEDNMLDQDMESNRIAPLSDVFSSLSEFVCYALVLWLYRADSHHDEGNRWGRSVIYTITAFYYIAQVAVCLSYRGQDDIINFKDEELPASQSECGGSQHISLLCRAVHSLYYFKDAFISLWRCRVAFHCIFRITISQIAWYTLALPATITSSSSWVSADLSNLPCQGAIPNIIMTAMFSQVFSVIVAILYLSSLTGMHPYRYYRYVHPVLGTIVVLLTSLILLRSYFNIYINSILMAIPPVGLYQLYEFDLMLGMAACEEKYCSFFYGLRTFVTALAMLIYPLLNALSLDTNVTFMVWFSMGLSVALVVHDYVFVRTSVDELQSCKSLH